MVLELNRRYAKFAPGTELKGLQTLSDAHYIVMEVIKGVGKYGAYNYLVWDVKSRLTKIVPKYTLESDSWYEVIGLINIGNFRLLYGDPSGADGGSTHTTVLVGSELDTTQQKE